jgi:hypothetical protein
VKISLSKKNLNLLIIVVAIVVAIIIAFGRDESSKAISSANNLLAGQKTSIPENPNWQSDLINIKGSSETTGVNNSLEKETVTDTVSRTLMSNYLALKQNDALNQESIQKLIDQTATFADQTGTAIDLNVKINTIPDNGIKTISAYGEDLGNLLKNNRPTYKKSEMDLVKEALENKDPEKLNQLNEIIFYFEKISKALKVMSVPEKFSKSHIHMINGIDAAALGLKEIKSVLSDSVKGIEGLQVYSQGVYIFSKAFKATFDFISSNQIDYKLGTGGYYLFHGI